MVAVSVIFSSRNGAAVLPQALEAFGQLTAPAGGWELIAVDNSSSDGTRQILKQFEASLPLVVLDMATPGKNRALNLAIERASGELLVFTDDDVMPQADWLVRLVEGVRQLPDYQIFGGTIRPFWPKAPPEWLRQSGLPLDMLYVINARNSGPVPADAVWGPNMAIRAAVFAQGWRFDEDIGPTNSKQYPMGSEVEFNLRLERAGFKAWFLAEAVVEHIIRDHQLERSWITGRAYRHGRGFSRYHPLPSKLEGGRLRGVPWPLQLRIWAYSPLAGLSRHFPRSVFLLRREYQLNWLRGLADAMRDQEPGAGSAS